MRNYLRKAEWTLALTMTLLAICMHLIFLGHAGGFWREEVGSIRLASRPGISAVWDYLFYDSFPAFWVLVLRGWIRLGLGSEFGLRMLGFFTGLFVLGSFWFNARRLRITFPFFSLLLLGFSPVILIWGDSMRAWGWGIAWITLTFGLIWRAVEDCSKRNVTAAAIAAIASVHSTYYNWVLLLALCCSGAVVAARMHQWRRSLVVLGIGFLAGLTTIPYLIGIHRVSGHYLMTQTPFTLAKFFSRLAFAVSDGGPIAADLWGMLAVAAAAAAIFCQVRPRMLLASPEQRDMLLFVLLTAAIGGVAYFLFLRNLKFSTQPWYYASFMAVSALAMDASLSILGNSDIGRKARLFVVLVALALIAPPMIRIAHRRMTNVDLIAQQLAHDADKRDLIVVNPWYCGISFDYYYSGAAPWITLPELTDHSYHCYETVVRIMEQPDQMEAIGGALQKIKTTLTAGGRVWFVGGLNFPPSGEAPLTLPPAPHGPHGWWSTPYQRLWSSEAGYFVQKHAVGRDNFVVAPDDAIVNPAEYLPLMRAQGWKDE